MDAAGKPQRLENNLQVINHGFYKVLENSEAMPAYLFQVGATLGVRLIVDCPGTVLTAQEERPSCDERGSGAPTQSPGWQGHAQIEL